MSFGRQEVQATINTREDGWGAELQVRAPCWPDWSGGRRFIDTGDLEVLDETRDRWVRIKNEAIGSMARFALVSAYTGHDYPDGPPDYM